MKTDAPMWIAVDFECMNVPINNNDNDNDNNDNNNDNNNENDNNSDTDKLFVNKPVATGYKIVKKPEYENQNLEEYGYIKYLVKIVLNGSQMRCWK